MSCYKNVQQDDQASRNSKNHFPKSAVFRPPPPNLSKKFELEFLFYEKKSCNLQVVSKALEAGLLCVGISNMTQFGLNGIGSNNSVKHGTCRNPIE